ncbi:protein kinase [Archangium violaceum]|uniref:serine/threonine-protein kinase n=1 Tax=Archangium violaceum TaxID=83451 RepID=UPI0019515F8A|nr:serine/threonine-protein kinase [Archangium violaceum]QRN93656.1 protein kinase [Archangium violaceum]
MHCPSCRADAGDVSKYCPACGATLARGEADEYIGRTIAQKYQVEALIGEGGMGKVYRARQVALDKLVVLKVLRHTLLGDDRTVARFKREAKAASRLNHPNSISILDFGVTEDGALFIAMEFVPGQDLHTVLSKDGPLPESRVARIVSQVLSALYDAHAAGVIHRDLKPENIMVEQRRNEPDFVKVLDFGIAKIQDGEDGPTLTRTGFVCGTPEYMSPEQARGATLDHRSDLYAVGVILYQLISGRLPFESDSAVGYATKHLTEEPVPPSRKRPEIRVSQAMERLIMRALSKSPDDRPQDAEAFKAELLAVEKEKEREPRERRTSVSASGRRTAGGSAGVFAPLPRRATPPPSGVSTEITDPWGSASDATVRAMPERMQPGAAMARMSQERTQLAPPSRPAPERERERPPPPAAHAPVRSATERLPADRSATERLPPVQALANDKTEAIVATVPDVGGGFGFLKAFVLTLALVTLGLAGYWLYTSWRNQATKAPFVPPVNAPIPGQEAGAFVPDPGMPLYEQQIPKDPRNLAEAQRRQQAGYDAYKNKNLDLAATEFRNAFVLNPSPELSLMLGEVYWAREITDEARGWWKRHLRDLPDSKARATILKRIPELSSAAGR